MVSPMAGTSQSQANRILCSKCIREDPTLLVDTYKQDIIDLHYFLQELQAQDLQHEVIVLIDVNKDDHQQYRAQGNTTQYVTGNHCHVDGC
jgi:hypothetical protein